MPMRISRRAAGSAGAAGRASAGTSGQIRPSMCQSSGCRRSPSANASATACIAPATRSLQPPGPVDRDLRGERRSRQPRSVELADAPGSARRRSAAPAAAAAAGHRSPSGRRSRPRRRRCRGRGRRAGRSTAGLAQPVAEHLGAGPRRRRSAGRSACPSDSPVVEEPPVQRLRLQPLGDGHERAAEAVDEPDAGGVPVAAVRQHHAPAPRPLSRGLLHVLQADDLGAGDDPLAAQRRQPERLLPVAGVGPQRRGVVSVVELAARTAARR